MNVSPHRVSFRKSMRGYHTRQVDAYIESLCAEFAAAEEDYHSRIVSLEKEIDQLKQELENCRAAEEENAVLREEVTQLRSRRIRFVHSKKTKCNKTQADCRARTERIFATGAELVRIVGKTGRQVSRFVAALPTPVAKTEEKAAPNNVKEAKQLLKSLNKQEKIARHNEKQAKKAKKIMRRVEKKRNELLKKA